jgi:hypothetical protein
MLFAASFLSFVYFHAGGGWNQNARFAQVRAIVESGALSIDSFLLYQTALPTSSTVRLRRTAVVDGEFERDGHRYALSWVTDAAGTLHPVSDAATGDPVALHLVSVSGDVTYAKGHFYPNKPPGITFLSLPAYWVLHSLVEATGGDSDDAWTLTRNAWLTSAFSVGLIAAFGTMAFFAIASSLLPDPSAALLATIAFTWGTIYFPYATTFVDHGVVAACLVIAVALVIPPQRNAGLEWRTWVAGFIAGLSILVSYIAVVPAAFIVVHVAHRRGVRSAARFVGGIAPSLVGIGAYDYACFGSPLMTSYAPAHPGFQSSGMFLNVFGVPRAHVFFALLFSPYRGLFYGSPFLAFGVAGT